MLRNFDTYFLFHNVQVNQIKLVLISMKHAKIIHILRTVKWLDFLNNYEWLSCELISLKPEMPLEIEFLM